MNETATELIRMCARETASSNLSEFLEIQMMCWKSAQKILIVTYVMFPF